jgi:DNA modification methylase
MPTTHICERCGKNFKQKSHLDAHMKRKRPCKKDDTLTKLIEEKVEEKVSELVNIRTMKKNEIDTIEEPTELVSDKKDMLHDSYERITPKVIIGDCLDVMRTFEAESIDLIVTSPPYWGQRDYKNEKQWGNEEDIKEYIRKMTDWGSECKRILKNSGSLFLNIGDKYIKKSLMMIPERIAISFSDNGWCLRNTIIWRKPNSMPSSVSDRFTNTYEVVYFFVKDSGKYFNYPYYSDIDCLRIKTKTPVKELEFPETLSLEDYAKWETKIMEFNKKKKYSGKFINETKNVGQSPGGRQSRGITYSLMRKHKLTKQSSLPINKFILEHYKKSSITTTQIDESFGYSDTASHWIRTDPGRSLPKPDDWVPLKKILNITDDIFDKVMTEQHYVLQNVKFNPKGKNPGDVWDIPTERVRESHYAVFPTELPRRIIRAFCPKDGIVLDPFAGSGTTGIAAKHLGISSILIDCNPEFKDIIEKRCK